MAEDFDAMEACCETVGTCVEPEICDYLFSGFIFVVFPFLFYFVYLISTVFGDPVRTVIYVR